MLVRSRSLQIFLFDNPKVEQQLFKTKCSDSSPYTYINYIHLPTLIMKLTHSIISEAPSVISPIETRTLLLRNLNLTSLDSIHVLESYDIHSTVDLSQNSIVVISEFPKLLRLNNLLLANNNIRHLSGLKNLINIEVLSLSYNEVLYLSDLEHLKQLKNLRSLYLNGNPVVKNKNYRSWCIWRFPGLQVLDFERIKDSERKTATSMFEDEKLVESILSIGSNPIVDMEEDASQNVNSGLSDEDRKRLEEELENAESIEEIQRLEEILNQGHF